MSLDTDVCVDVAKPSKPVRNAGELRMLNPTDLIIVNGQPHILVRQGAETIVTLSRDRTDAPQISYFEIRKFKYNSCGKISVDATRYFALYGNGFDNLGEAKKYDTQLNNAGISRRFE